MIEKYMENRKRVDRQMKIDRILVKEITCYLAVDYSREAFDKATGDALIIMNMMDKLGYEVKDKE